MIKIEQLLPLLKKGYVAMDYNNDWYFYKKEPELRIGSWAVKSSTAVFLSDAFDIEPAKDWTKSLMRCGDE